MAKAGDYFIIVLKDTHLNWGEHRYTNSREKIQGEGYIPIPAGKARELKIYNGNGTDYKNILGVNIFNCKSIDGYFKGLIKAQGSSEAKSIYAKQFSAVGNLKEIGKWFNEIGAKPGDEIKVQFTSPTDIIIEKL